MIYPDPGTSIALRTAARLLSDQWAPGVEPVFVRAFSNHVYLLPSAAGRLYLRITSGVHRSEPQLRSELEFVRILSRRGVSVSDPVPSRSGGLVRPLNLNGQTYYASVFREAQGCEFANLPQTARRAFLREAGATMGRLHSEGRRFARPLGFQRFPWSDDRWMHFSTFVPEREREAWQLYRELESWTRELSKDPSLFGLIHGDFTILNMRIDGERITLFDFDSCCENWYGYEIATFLHYFGGLDPAARSEAYQEVLSGYAESAPLDDRMIAAIPLFGKMRLLYSYLVFAETWGFEDLSPEQEGYFALRRRLFSQEPTWPPG